jgi:hypothetical protein
LVLDPWCAVQEELHTFFDEELFKQTQTLIAQARGRREEAEKAIQEKKEREEKENARRYTGPAVHTLEGLRSLSGWSKR